MDILFPRYCLICGRNLSGYSGAADYLCRSCIPETMYSRGIVCSVCSKQLISEKDICMRCRTRQYAFLRNVSLFSYTGSGRTLLQSYKFEGHTTLAPYFGRELYSALISEFGLLPVVPVPSRKRTKKERGGDHVEKICRILNKQYGLQILPLLSRKGKKAQKTLGYEDRLHNMKGSIVPAGKAQIPPEAVVLLDDVFTTGATAHECSLVLKQMGVKRVYVLTIALD